MRKPKWEELIRRPAMFYQWIDFFQCYQIRIIYPDGTCEVLDSAMNNDWELSMFDHEYLYENPYQEFLGFID